MIQEGESKTVVEATTATEGEGEGERKSYFKWISGDICKQTVDAIVQQCNCVTATEHGLSDTIGKAFPLYGRAYAHRKPKSKGATWARAADYDKPGTLRILTPLTVDTKRHQPHIACLLAQEQPSKPGRFTPVLSKDTAEVRRVWFARCLAALAKEAVRRKWKTIAFPRLIGCDLAGGSWPLYLVMLESFARRVSASGITCIMVCWNKGKTGAKTKKA